MSQANRDAIIWALLQQPEPQGLGMIAQALSLAPSPPASGFSELLAALAAPIPPTGLTGSPLGALSNFSLCAPAPSTRPSPSIFGSAASSIFGGGGGGTSIFSEFAKMDTSKPKRRVFFSFHYQNDINRVNVVRNSWRIRPEDDVAPVEWFDHSIWEDAKKTGAAALKKLIHEGMNYSSVTCVLAGTDTWSRPWVRYELAYAMARGNGLLTVHIDGVNCMRNGVCARGPNPLDFLALGWDNDDKAYIWEKVNGAWRKYAAYSAAVTWPKWLPNVSSRDKVMPFSNGSMAYDYAKQNGFQNLSGWAQLAADQAQR